jgi:hypothetical protein
VRRNWLVVAIVVAIGAIVLAAVLARVTDDDSGSLDTATWADSACTELSDWRSSILALADVSGTLTPDVLQEKLDDARAATQELVADLEDLGPPDLESGDDVERALDDAVAGIESSYESLEQAAEEAAEAGSQGAFLQALAGLAGDFQALLAQPADAVETLQSASLFGEASAELEQAFSQSESCQALTAE